MMPPEEMITEAQCRAALREIEMDPDDYPISVHLPTGYMLFAVDFDQVIFPWDLVLNHGKKYIRHIQEWDYPPEIWEDRVAEHVKLVGGSFPW